MKLWWRWFHNADMTWIQFKSCPRELDMKARLLTKFLRETAVRFRQSMKSEFGGEGLVGTNAKVVVGDGMWCAKVASVLEATQALKRFEVAVVGKFIPVDDGDEDFGASAEDADAGGRRSPRDGMMRGISDGSASSEGSNVDDVTSASPRRILKNTLKGCRDELKESVVDNFFRVHFVKYLVCCWENIIAKAKSWLPMQEDGDEAARSDGVANGHFLSIGELLKAMRASFIR